MHLRQDICSPSCVRSACACVIQETKTSSLLAYGDKQWSAMAITVGYPTAVGVQLILDGMVLNLLRDNAQTH